MEAQIEKNALSLLEEIREGQTQQPAIQTEALALQRENFELVKGVFERAFKIQDWAERIQDYGARLVATARKSTGVIFPVILLLLATRAPGRAPSMPPPVYPPRIKNHAVPEHAYGIF